MKKNNILYIKFKKIRGYYSLEKMLDHNIDNLPFFLTDEIGSDGEWWLRFLDNPKEDMRLGNMQELVKEGDKVFIGCQFRLDNEDRDPHAFETTILELKRIIKEWLALLKESPNEIIITYENGKVELKGV